MRASPGAQRRASGSYGAKVGLAEGSPQLGGTCVNVGEYDTVKYSSTHTDYRFSDRMCAQEDHVVHCRRR